MEPLQPGDVFATRNPMMLGRAINGVQRFWSADNASVYSHAGIITGKGGGTFESLGTIRRGSLSNYSGKRILIARPLNVQPSSVATDLLAFISAHQGTVYPFWRLALHLIPPMAKHVGVGNFLVCSELVAKWLFVVRVRHGQYRGATPDMLADEWREHKGYEILFEGVYP